MSVSSLALARYNVRNTQPSDIVQEGQQNRNNSGLSGLDDFLDRHFPDERMERIYPNAKIVQE